jgi:cytochrome c-type biogenesis protein CcsB
MKQIVKMLSAPWMMGGLFILWAAAMAMATFVENDYGTPAAKYLVYNAWWFELIMLLLAINMLGNVFSFKMWRKEKIPVLLFHLSFFIILAGASITRYVGYEGLLHIREGETSKVMFSYDPHVTAEWQSDGDTDLVSVPAYLSPATPNAFKATLVAGDIKIKVRSVAFKDEKLVLEVVHQGETHHLMVQGNRNAIGDAAVLELPGGRFRARFGAKPIELPFSVRLNRFILDRYPGSESPSGYKSEVTLIDENNAVEEDHSVFMNNILNYKGYRLYQSSYDQDEKGTVLSVNHDGTGTIVTYMGYFLMTLSMFWALLAPNTRFRALMNQVDRTHRKRKKTLLVMLVLLLWSGAHGAVGQAPPAPDKELAAEFGALWVQDKGGRIKPLNSLHQEMALKLVKHHSFNGMTADQMVLGFFTHPGEWQTTPLITVKNPQLREILGVTEKKAAFVDFFDESRQYRLHQMVDDAHRKNPAERNKLEQELIKIDEQVNVFYITQLGQLHRIFPSSQDLMLPWYTPTSQPTTLSTADSLFVTTSIRDFIAFVRSGDVEKASGQLVKIRDYQESHSEELLPSDTLLNLELLYNRLSIFLWLSTYFFGIGALLLLFQFVTLLKPRLDFKWVMRIGQVLLLGGFIYYTFGMALRWVLAGHAPWSNGYESMIFIGWTIMFAALIFVRKSTMILPIAGLFSGLVLMIAHLSWMNPQITNLVPVLQSYWLTLHVSIITAGYGFLALGALLGFLSLLIVILRNERNYERLQLTITELTSVNEMALTAGLYLMTIGSFLGGVWANESWGRYWGWDPKETWSLITIVLYAFVLHMRVIPGLKGQVAFNTAAMLTFSSVIMTYLGVNYYLAGMHSYAGGDPVPIPVFVYYTLAVFGVLIVLSQLNEAKLRKVKGPVGENIDG